MFVGYKNNVLKRVIEAVIIIKLTSKKDVYERDSLHRDYTVPKHAEQNHGERNASMMKTRYF